MKKIKRFFSYIPLTLRVHFYSLRAAWEYRVSFFIQVGGMFVNDILLLFIWILFFDRFEEVNGWTFVDTQKIFAMNLLIFAFGMMLFGGVLELARKIEEGDLDLYLTHPRSVMWRVLSNNFSLSIIGDLVLGIIVLGYVCFTQGWIYMLLIPLSAISGAWGMIMIAACAQSLGFWFKRFDRAAWHYFWAVESPGFYPQTAIVGGLRIFLMTVVPSVWIITFPYAFISEKAWKYLTYGLAFNVVVTILAVLLFRSGLKRYESGSLMNINS